MSVQLYQSNLSTSNLLGDSYNPEKSRKHSPEVSAAAFQEALTTMHLWTPPGRQFLTRRVTNCAADGLLCRLTLDGSAATVA